MRVLLAGRSNADLRETAAAVRAAGHEVFEAGDQRAALALLHDQRPDLALLDAGSGALCALETVRALRQCSHDAWFPIFILNEAASSLSLAEALAAGADHCLAPGAGNPGMRAALGLAERITGLRRALAASSRDLQRADQQLLRQSRVDGLTGVANRRHFDNLLSTEWQRAQRTTKAVALLLIDIDHFRQFNKGYGHAQGDDCLVRVARCLAGGVHRAADTLSRYRGDTFAVVLPETDEGGAARLAQRLIEGIRSARIPHGCSPVADHVSVSIGCVALRPGTEAVGLGPECLIARADSALREAKRWGRNRFTRASEVADVLPA